MAVTSRGRRRGATRLRRRLGIGWSCCAGWRAARLKAMGVAAAAAGGRQRPVAGDDRCARCAALRRHRCAPRAGARPQPPKLRACQCTASCLVEPMRGCTAARVRAGRQVPDRLRLSASRAARRALASKRGAMERQLSHRPFIQATPGKRRAASGGQVAGVRRRSSCRLLSPPGAPNPHAPWSYVCTAVRLHSHACELHASCVHRALVGRQPCVLGVRIRCLLPQHLHKRQAAALLRLQAVFTAKEYVLQGASKVCA